MSATAERYEPDEGRFPPLFGEARWGLEFAGLVAAAGLRPPRPVPDAPPVLLIPGFMAGDASLVVLRAWLAARGHAVAMSGIRLNVDCAERAMTRLPGHLGAFVQNAGAPAIVIGQSRGGTLARCLAVRHPELVSGLVTLGSPVLDPLAVSAPVLRLVRSVAMLAQFGLPGTFSRACAEGECCADFRRDLAAKLPATVRATAIYSRTDGIVDWRACLDPDADQVQVSSSHCGMGVNAEVYRVLDKVLVANEG